LGACVEGRRRGYDEESTTVLAKFSLNEATLSGQCIRYRGEREAPALRQAFHSNGRTRFEVPARSYTVMQLGA